jgi:hypothetical protein
VSHSYEEVSVVSIWKGTTLPGLYEGFIVLVTTGVARPPRVKFEVVEVKPSNGEIKYDLLG